MKQLKNGKRRKTTYTFVICQKVLFSGKSSFSSFSRIFSVHAVDLDILGAERVYESSKAPQEILKNPKMTLKCVFHSYIFQPFMVNKW